MALKDKIRNYALQNAIKFDGKANPGAVIGKLLADDQALKSKIKTIARDVQKIIGEIGSLSVANMRKELEKSAPELLEEKKGASEKELPDLKRATSGKVVMRFEPSPSGPLHIGHAYVLALNAAFVEKYKGKFILKIGDTNPENIYEPAYKLIPEDVEWLTKGKLSEVLIQSERLEIYYNYMERLIGLDKAYICTCDPEIFKEDLRKGKACPCRELRDQLDRWRKMFEEYQQGFAVARVKTDLEHKNPAMRDFPVFRINESEHPKQKKKYRVWPLMNMAVSCDDIESGVTHVIRAKDHADNAKRQEFIYDYLGKKAPEAMFVGRINFEDLRVSASETREAIEKGKFVGWDDIRLPFLQALKKRGYTPEAFVKYAIEVGMSLTDKTVKKEDYYKALDSYNKAIIDDTSHRYFFVKDPVKITIEKAPSRTVELDLHPEFMEGGRKLEVGNTFFITQEDYNALEDRELYRLMDCLNFTKKGKKFTFDSKEYEKYKKSGKRIMHWVTEDHVNVEVLLGDNTIVSGVGEKTLTSVKEGSIVQLERFGFCRLDVKDKKKEELVFWFGHK